MSDLTPAARAAALKILADRVGKEYGRARADAEASFARLRAAGVTQVEVALPDGSVVGKVSILSGTVTVTWDEAALVGFVERTAPTEVVEVVDPAVLGDPELVAWVAEHRPSMVARSVRASYMHTVESELTAGGELVDPVTGELVKVADVARAAPSGAFSYRKTKDAAAVVEAAWRSGALGELSPVLAGVLEAAPGGAR